MGWLAPRVLSRKTDGMDGFAKKLAAKASPVELDETLDEELLHPEDVPEIVTQRSSKVT